MGQVLKKNNNEFNNLSEKQYEIYDDAIGKIITGVMCAFALVPLVVSVVGIVSRDIDTTLTFFLYLVKDILFPYGCVLIFSTYLIPVFVGKIKLKLFLTFLKSNPVFIVFIITVVWFFISQIYNAPRVIWIGYWDSWMGETFNMEVAYIVFILFGATQINKESQKKLVFHMHMISSMFVALAFLVLWLSSVEAIKFYDCWGLTGSIFPQENNYGYYLAVTVALSGALFTFETSRIWTCISLSSFIINAVALSFNNTFGAWIASALAIVFLIISRKISEKKVNGKTLLLIPIFLICIFIPAYTQGTFSNNFIFLSRDISAAVNGENVDAIGSGRGEIWKAALKIIDQNKLFGVGFEGVLYNYIVEAINIRPHNEFMQYALFHGIPAAVLYFIGCLGVYIRALCKKKYLNNATLCSLTAAFAYLVSSFFGLTLYSSAYFLFMFLGMGYVKNNSRL